MLIDNNLTWKQRIKELFIDYVCICIYLLILFGVTMGFYHSVLGHIPDLSELQSQLIATVASVLPIVIIFSVWDYKNGSIGKKKSQLKLYYIHNSFKASLLRNVIKFLPWQLAHIGVIHGVYSNFDLTAIALTSISLVLAIIMLLMGLVRKDKRHLGDLISGTQVQAKQIDYSG